MKLKTIVVAFFAILMTTAFSTSAMAELFSVSAGIPLSQSFSSSDLDSSGTSGYMLHVNLPIVIGIGLESYESTIRTPTGAKVSTMMFDVFYLFTIEIHFRNAAGNIHDDILDAGIACQAALNGGNTPGTGHVIDPKNDFRCVRRDLSRYSCRECWFGSGLIINAPIGFGGVRIYFFSLYAIIGQYKYPH